MIISNEHESHNVTNIKRIINPTECSYHSDHVFSENYNIKTSNVKSKCKNDAKEKSSTAS